MSENRKLAAILAADVAGFSRLTATDEERTVARLRGLRTDLIDPAISVHHGRVVKRTGDGILIEFRSVVDAVRLAIEVQNGMVERNAGLPPDRQIVFRVGIHLGDVIEEADGDLMGDGINIAARLENICEPGAICLSEQAYWQVKSRLDLTVSDLGAKDLKNIPEPVHVYSLEVGKPAQAKPIVTVAPLAAPPPKKRSPLVPMAAGLAALIVIVAIAAWYFLAASKQSATVANAPAHLSIVVLPFANLSNDPKQDYFADGITENLTTDLSRIRNSFVIARNTAFTYKGKNVDAKEIGKDLGVRYVLEGSVQRDGNRVRVNAQLIDAESGAHLWADRFEEDLSDLFKLQDDVVARLANTLGYELMKAEAARSVHSTNPDAIDLAMQGWAILNRSARSPESTRDAGALFERALQLDQNNDSALAGVADAQLINFAYGWGQPKVDFDLTLVPMADKAIAINTYNPAAYLEKSMYLFLTKRGAEAFNTADAGLASNPNSAQLYFARAGAENSLGRFEQAKADIAAAFRMSPRDPDVGRWYWTIGQAELGLGHYEAAVAQFHRAIEVGRRDFVSYVNLASANALAGHDAEAKAALAEAKRLNPKLTVKWWIDHGPSMPILFEGIRKAGLEEDAPPKHLSIVVLPFTNLSGDPKQDYFADGITENLTTDLSRIRNSFVIARNTAFTYKGKNVDAKEIGKELGVRYVLEGSVQRDGNRVRVNAQLIDAESGAHLWADRFEEDLADLFKLQDQVVARLANALGSELVRAEAAKSARSANPDAIDLSMQGWAILNTPGRDQATHDQARMLFDRALKLDPNDDSALAGIATIETRYFAYGWGRANIDYDSEIIPAADRAIALNLENMAAYSFKAVYLSLTNRAGESLETANAGLTVDSNSAQLYNARAGAERSLGRFAQAKADILLAMRLSPRDWDVGRWHALLGEIEMGLGHYDVAIEEEHRAIGVGFVNYIPFIDLSAAYELAGKDAEAKAALAEARKLNPKLTGKWWMHHGPSMPILYEAIRKAGLPEDDGPRLSIVVLPFNNIGDPSQDYVADAITEELTTALAKLRDSFVIARNTAMTYRGKPVDVKQIGRDLNVRYALEGSVQRGGNRLRVNVQLIDAESGAHLWADQFDQPRAELLEMQDAIVTRLGRALDLKLTDADIARTARTKADNLDAEDLALRCRSEFEHFYAEGPKLQEAYGLCQKAVALDPRNITALGILAWRAIEPVVFLRSADPALDIRKADELVSRAFAVDPNDFTAHWVKSHIFDAEGRFAEGDEEASRSLASNPSYVAAYEPQCYADNYLGQPQKAIDCVDKALRLSPRDPLANFFYLQKGFGQLQLDRYADAVDSLRRAVVLTPDELLTKDQLGYNIMALVDAGQSDDRNAAIAEADEIATVSLGVNQNDFFARFVKARVLIAQSHNEEAITEIAKVPPGIRLIYFVYHAKCDALAHLGRAEETIECAEKLIALGPHQNLHVEYLDKGWALIMKHKDAEAIAAFRKAIEVRPTASFPRAYLAAAFGETGHEAEARDALKQYLAAHGVRMKTVASWRDYWGNWPTRDPVVLDFCARFLGGLRKAGMPEQ